MGRYSVAQYKILLSFIIISILVTVLWFKFKKNESNILAITMESTAAVFANKVMMVHAQWLMTGKDDIVYIKESHLGTGAKVENIGYRVNEFGWPDLSIDHDACARLWQKMTGIELEVVNQPIAVIEVKGTQKVEARVCRYHLNAKHYIEYNSASGKITNKN